MSFLTVDNLSVGIGKVPLLDHVGFTIDKGEILGLVGESGSGKSLTALTLMGLLPLIGGKVLSGTIRFDGIELTTLAPAAYRDLRGRRIALISQNPMTSLDPIRTVGEQIDQVSRLHGGLDAEAARARSLDLMQQLRISEPAAIHGHFPHQLSGGMRQRIVIAMALAGDPDLIIADEPTTALDVTIQAQIIQILADLVASRGLALLLITHDMGVVAQACHRVSVLYAGRVAETGPVAEIFARPRHPYTKALIGCIPQEGQPPGSLKGIPGMVPSAALYPTGCRFSPRCEMVAPDCSALPPPPVTTETGTVWCWHPLAGADV